MKKIKLFFVLLLLCSSSIYASSYAETAKLNISVKNVSLEYALKQIEKQSDFLFFYNLEDINKDEIVSIHKENANIKDVLDTIISEKGLKYTIKGRHIILTKVEKTKSSVVTDQEDNIIKGSVVDNNGEPIIGANVIVKGTKIGTITDSNGKFSIETKRNQTLVISYIGYADYIVKVGNQNFLDITLMEDNQALDELVVVGYGVSKKRDLTGSVASVKKEQIQEIASLSAVQAMQGRAAGVTITQTNAKPGTDLKVRIRGNRSLKATNEPLYVVDGIPIVGGLNEISPSDIESIEILKDASATAIYGSRGANGVILVTTKKGISGTAQIDYNGYVGVQQAAKKIEMFDGAGWVELVREANRATLKGSPYPLTPTLDWDRKLTYFSADPNVFGKIEAGYDENGIWHPENVSYNDWTEEALRVAPIHNHEISARGGTDKIKILASATYFGQDGIIRGQDYRRYSLRFNFDWDLTKFVKIGGSTSFSHVDRNNGENLYEGTKRHYPLADIYDEKGAYTTNRPGNDPQLWNVFLDLDNAKREIKHDRFLGSYYLEVKLPFDIKYRTNVGIDISPVYNNEFYGALSNNRSGSPAKASNSRSNRRLYTWENLLFYNKSFAEQHNLGITFLQSIQQETFDDSSIDVKDLPYENQLYYNVGSAQTIEGVSSNYQKWNLASFMGRVNYNYKDRYLLTVSARYDGSSRLAPDHKWVLFPSAALAWRINEESFFDSAKNLSNLKLRLGWGITGNTAIAPYKTQGGLSYGRYNFGSEGVLTFFQNEMPNPLLSWEKTQQWNLGLDFGVLNGRIGGSIDLYLQKTKDLLMDRQLPIVSGFNNVITNIGQIQNKGIEFTLNTLNIKNKDFTWSTDFMLSINKEEIVELYNGKVDDEGNQWFIGKPVNVFYDYKNNGIWQIEDKEELTKWGGKFKPGDIKIIDRNGDYKITSEDRFILGHENPNLTLSMGNNFKYKNIDFSFFLNGAFGQMNQFDRNWSFNGRYNGAKVNYWRIIGQDEKGNPISNHSNEAPRPNVDFENPPYVNTFYYQKASFLRLSNIILGYTFPKKLLFGLDKLRLYASIQNAYVFTNFDGTDPESGRDFSEPMPRTFLFGANVSF